MSFAQTARSALAGPLGDAALELLFDAAARRGEVEVAGRALLSTPGSSQATRERLWAHPYAATAVLDNPAVLDGAPLEPMVLVALVEHVLAGLEEDEEPPHQLRNATSGPALARLVTVLGGLLSADPESDWEPSAQEESALRATAERLGARDVLLDLARTGGTRQHVATLAGCLPDREAWLRALLPTLDPSKPDEATLLVLLTQLEGVDPSAWAALRWADLRASVPARAAYAARLLDAAAVRVTTPAQREAFAVLSEGWTGTVEELAAACASL